jgi:hypothetical protein
MLINLLSESQVDEARNNQRACDVFFGIYRATEPGDNGSFEIFTDCGRICLGPGNADRR